MVRRLAQAGVQPLSGPSALLYAPVAPSTYLWGLPQHSTAFNFNLKFGHFVLYGYFSSRTPSSSNSRTLYFYFADTSGTILSSTFFYPFSPSTSTGFVSSGTPSTHFGTPSSSPALRLLGHFVSISTVDTLSATASSAPKLQLRQQVWPLLQQPPPRSSPPPQPTSCSISTVDTLSATASSAPELQPRLQSFSRCCNSRRPAHHRRLTQQLFTCRSAASTAAASSTSCNNNSLIVHFYNCICHVFSLFFAQIPDLPLVPLKKIPPGQINDCFSSPTP